MSFLDYSEDALVEKPAIQLLESLGWTALNAYGEFEHGVSSLGRETKAEVILTTRLRQTLRDLNNRQWTGIFGRTHVRDDW